MRREVYLIITFSHDHIDHISLKFFDILGKYRLKKNLRVI